MRESYRSPTKVAFPGHPHHARFASSSSSHASPPPPSDRSSLTSASASTSPIVGSSSVFHCPPRSFSVSTPPREQPSFQPRVLDDVFSSPADYEASLVTPSRATASQPSWLHSTPHQQSFPTAAPARDPPPTISTSFLGAPPTVGQPLFSPFDPFAASSTSAGKSPSAGTPSPLTPSTAYIESLTQHRGSFIRSLSSQSDASTSSSFSAGDPYQLASPPTDDEMISPSGETLSDVTEYYFQSGAHATDDEGQEEEMMTESDTTESEARTLGLLSPMRTERSTYAEQLREHTLSMMMSVANSSPGMASPAKAASSSNHQRRTSVASDGSLSGVGMRRGSGARDNIFRNVAIYQEQEDPRAAD